MLDADFKTVALDSRGLDFIRSSLAGPHRLSQLLGQTVVYDQGTIQAYVPACVPEDSVYDLRVGVRTLAMRSHVRSEVVAGRPRTPNQAIADLVISALEEHQGGLCLVEDWLLTPSDPGVQLAVSSGAPIVFSGNDVYHYVLRRDRWEKVAEALDEADWGKLVGAISVDEFPQLVPGKEIDSDLLAEIARTARLVFITAYDGEGFVLWERLR